MKTIEIKGILLNNNDKVIITGNIVSKVIDFSDIISKIEIIYSQKRYVNFLKKYIKNRERVIGEMVVKDKKIYYNVDDRKYYIEYEDHNDLVKKLLEIISEENKKLKDSEIVGFKFYVDKPLIELLVEGVED